MNCGEPLELLRTFSEQAFEQLLFEKKKDNYYKISDCSLRILIPRTIPKKLSEIPDTFLVQARALLMS